MREPLVHADVQNFPVTNEQLYALLIFPEFYRAKNIDSRKATRRALGFVEHYGAELENIDFRMSPDGVYSELLEDWLGILKSFDFLRHNFGSPTMELSKRGEDVVVSLVNEAYQKYPKEVSWYLDKVGIGEKEFNDFLFGLEKSRKVEPKSVEPKSEYSIFFDSFSLST